MLMERMKKLLKVLKGEQLTGRPVGSGTDEAKIKEYLEHNPGASVTKIANDLKISRTTVYKWTKWQK